MTAVRDEDLIFETHSSISSNSKSESSLDSEFDADERKLKHWNGAGRKSRVNGDQSKLMVCNVCSRTFRHDLMSEHFQEFHPKVQCSFCEQNVDRFELRKHQERYCPERLSICPHCYVQLPNSHLSTHLTSCQPKRQNLPKPKVLPNKELSFKGTVFEDHARIASSYINLARGHPAGKPLSQMIVKAEMKMNEDVALAKCMNELVDAFCSSSAGNLGQDVADTKTKTLPPRIATPLKEAIIQNDEFRKCSMEKVKQMSAASSAQNLKDSKILVKPLKPPAEVLHTGIEEAKCILRQLQIKAFLVNLQLKLQAERVRQIHQSLSNTFRDDCSRRKFIKNWLKYFYVSKAKLQEEKIKEEERVEDDIIDEAIQLELQNDVLQNIPRNKWPYFVEAIKHRRRKWKDLGFGLEESKEFIKDQDPIKLGTSFLPNRKLMDNSATSNIVKRKENNNYSRGFYKSCEFCFQLFHEDELQEHAIACKAQKEKAAKRKQEIKGKSKPKSNFTLNMTRNPTFHVPRPFPQEIGSSLALAVAPHDKTYRTGESNYSFLVKAGRL